MTEVDDSWWGHSEPSRPVYRCRFCAGVIEFENGMVINENGTPHVHRPKPLPEDKQNLRDILFDREDI
jgi:hypothetical protein